MLTPREESERAMAAERTRSLLRAAVAAFPQDPQRAQDWLVSPHPDLLGTIPVAAAWHSDRLAKFAMFLLESDAREIRSRQNLD